ncbi:MAG: sugar ABC transporter permease [Chloroflexi bacterium]|nr:sugar ABC transporter permease [Chloroflexota bacterium]
MSSTLTPALARQPSMRSTPIWERPAFLGYILLAPMLLLVVGLSAVPMAYSLWMFVHNYNPLRPENTAFVGLGNVQQLLADPRVWSGLRTTLTYALIAVPASFILGLAIALLFNNDFPGVKVFRGLALLPLMVMPVAVGLTFQMLFNYQFGLFNWIIMSLHGPRLQWLSDPTLAFASIVVLDVWQNTPFAMLVLLAGLRTVPAEPLEAARVDGASGWQTFVHVTLPMLRPVILVVFLLRFIGTFKLFDEIYSLTQAGPGHATETLAYYVYVLGFQAFDLGYASAVSYLLLLCLAIVGVVLIVRLERDQQT